jgi:hypothetical protein
MKPLEEEYISEIITLADKGITKMETLLQFQNLQITLEGDLFC